MQDNTPSTARLAIKYGLMTGAAYILYSFALELTNLEDNTTLSLLGSVIAIAGIVYAMTEFKRSNEGYMFYSQGLGLGTLVSFISGLLLGFFNLIYLSLNKSKIEQAKNQLIVEYEKMGLKDEEIEQVMPLISWIVSPGGMFIVIVLSSLIWGFILTLIISAFMRKDKPVFDE